MSIIIDPGTASLKKELRILGVKVRESVIPLEKVGEIKLDRYLITGDVLEDEGITRTSLKWKLYLVLNEKPVPILLVYKRVNWGRTSKEKIQLIDSDVSQVIKTFTKFFEGMNRRLPVKKNHDVMRNVELMLKNYDWQDKNAKKSWLRNTSQVPFSMVFVAFILAMACLFMMFSLIVNGPDLSLFLINLTFMVVVAILWNIGNYFGSKYEYR